MGLTLTSEEYYQHYLSYDDQDFFSHFLRDRNYQTSPDNIRRLVALKSLYYVSSIREHIPVIKTSLKFILSLPESLPLAIASGAAKREISFILSELKLEERFSTTIAAEDVMRGKPDPEAFLQAFQAFKRKEPALPPERVVVFEDSFNGIRSAHRAGMKCVALATSYPADRLAEADLVLDSLQDWNLKKLERALS